MEKDPDAAHNKRYHNDDNPVSFTSCWTGRLMTIRRTGDLKNYHCPHSACDFSSSIRSSCASHHKKCKLYIDDHNGARVERIISSTISSYGTQTAEAGSSSTVPSTRSTRLRSSVVPSAQSASLGSSAVSSVQPSQETRLQGKAICIKDLFLSMVLSTNG